MTRTPTSCFLDYGLSKKKIKTAKGQGSLNSVAWKCPLKDGAHLPRVDQ